MNARLKLFIADILDLKVSVEDNSYILNNLHFKAIEIVGIVKHKKGLRNNVTSYQVDDGTGVIECIRFNEERALPQIRVAVKMVSKLLLERVNRVIASEKDLQVGTTVKIQGYIVEYKGKREIRIRRIIPIMDRNQELFHLYEKLALYEEIYGTRQLEPTQ